MADIFEVIGGASKGGIIVRSSKDVTSKEAKDRLATGAIIQATDYDEASGRLRYVLLEGNGPSEGWVSTAFQGKDMLARLIFEFPENEQELEPACVGVQNEQQDSLYASYAQLAQGRGSVGPKRTERKTNLTMGVGRIQYGAAPGNAKTGVESLGVTSYQQFKPASGKAPRSVMKPGPRPAPAVKEAVVEEAAGLRLCPQCSLPLGDFGYEEEGGALLHGECKAQRVLQQSQQEEKQRARQEAQIKRNRRKEHSIGWKTEHIPRNSLVAGKMGLESAAPSSMCCIVFDEPSHSVSVAPTVDPATSVNLEYLSLALQVRSREGREPRFSLDPKDEKTSNPKDMWQVKNFEPEWVAGTSLGEVMFQADVYLKELSMGEYQQPVAGMQSGFDVSESEGHDKEWNGRLWYVVDQAEVLFSEGEEGDAVIPRVQMAVEAREQTHTTEGLVDAPITRSDHPLVKYAETFTQYFDLIAERKSVVYHLREMAKATLLAKFLLQADLKMDDSWYHMGAAVKESPCREIPMLWNERCYTQIEVKDGQLVDAEKGIATSTYGLYGGVALGLDRGAVAVAGEVRRPKTQFTMAQAHITKQAALLEASPEMIAYPTAAVGAPARAPMRALSAVAAARGMMPSVRGVVPAAGLAMASASTLAPRGVDMNLDGFDVSAPARAEPRMTQVASGAIGRAFWASIDSDTNSVFSEQDARFFKYLFNPMVCDRREEGDLFVPPETRAEYMQKLRALIKKEEETQRERVEAFLSESFNMDKPGTLFPSSWTSSSAIVDGGLLPKARELRARPDYISRSQDMLKSAVPKFDRTTEDGLRFRVYNSGSLEIRTTQENGAKEVVGVVFQISAPSSAIAVSSKDWATLKNERVVSVTQHVEVNGAGHRYYVVLESEGADFIVMERLRDGSVAWVENPKDLEARNSLARVTRFVNCRSDSFTVQDVKNFQTREAQRSGSRPMDLDCKVFSDGACDLAAAAQPERTWQKLTDAERLAAKELGIDDGRAWDTRTAKIFQKGWVELTPAQSAAAEKLSFDRSSWALFV